MTEGTKEWLAISAILFGVGAIAGAASLTLSNIFSTNDAVVTPITIGPITASPPLSPDEIRQAAIKRQAQKFGVDPILMMAISEQENPAGLPLVWSSTGCCFGTMQVNLETWYGAFHDVCGGSDLLDPDQSACYGIQIYLWHLRRCEGDRDCALRDYSGDADMYVERVQRRQERLQQEELK